jgi:hypothetical protein
MMQETSVAALLPVNQAHGWSHYSLAVVQSTIADKRAYGSGGLYGDYGYGYGYDSDYGYGYYASQLAAATMSSKPERRKLIEAGKALNRVSTHKLVQAATSRVAAALPLLKCPACPACAVSSDAGTGTPSKAAAAGRSIGSCYCPYNDETGTWDLAHHDCRATLLKKCGPSGALLECAHVESMFSGWVAGALNMPHREDVSNFLFVDCPPPPPCVCKALLPGQQERDALLDGVTAALARQRCCRMLKAHCQVPFSGIGCGDIMPYCTSTKDMDDVTAAYVAVKTHGINCSQPGAGDATRLAAALGSTSSDRSADLAATQEEIEMLVLQNDMAERARLAGDKARQFYAGLTVGSVLTGACVAITAVVVGLTALMHHLRQVQYTRPVRGDAFF